MLYRLLKFPARVALHFWCRHSEINDRGALRLKGPLIIAANHPNSFLDAVFIATLFDEPVYSLARGDAFHKPWHARLLRAMNMLPVYRLSEGAANLGYNYETFDACLQLFKKNGIVLIFSEGRCVNEWHLRPLKKGTARLSFDAWDKQIPLRILPAGMNYSSFKKFGKNIRLNFGELINKEQLDNVSDQPRGTQIVRFNELLQRRLSDLVIQIKPADPQMIRRLFFRPLCGMKKILLGLPAFFGYLFHAPVYFAVKYFVSKFYLHNDHFDSVMVGALFLTYPLWLTAVTVIISGITQSMWGIAAAAVLPFCAWSLLQMKSDI